MILKICKKHMNYLIVTYINSSSINGKTSIPVAVYIKITLPLSKSKIDKSFANAQLRRNSYTLHSTNRNMNGGI